MMARAGGGGSKDRGSELLKPVMGRRLTVRRETLARRQKKNSKADGAVLPVMNPDAAGIDIGSTEVYVAVPAESGRRVSTLLPDIHTRPVCAGRVAPTMRDQDGGDGIHGCVLDSVVSDSGGSCLGGVSGESSAREERTGTKHYWRTTG